MTGDWHGPHRDVIMDDMPPTTQRNAIPCVMAVTFMLLVALITAWHWSLSLVVVAAGFYWLNLERRIEHRGFAERADAQNQACLRGDRTLGIYGIYPPEVRSARHRLTTGSGS